MLEPLLETEEGTVTDVVRQPIGLVNVLILLSNKIGRGHSTTLGTEVEVEATLTGAEVTGEAIEVDEDEETPCREVTRPE